MYIGGLLSIFAINTWLLPYVNFGPNGSSWTICTLSFWYWCFPFILPRMQRWTDKELAHGIVKTFWLSVALSLMVYVGFGEVNWKKATVCYIIEYSLYEYYFLTEICYYG
jgi:peptidoglycan/LPS O-acetylase OafA/YrhL